MLVIIDTFFRIALRRLGPEDLPASSFLLLLVIPVWLLLQAALGYTAYGWSRLPGVLLADLLLLVACLWGLLRFVGKPARFLQTLTAILGVSAVLSAIALPFSVWWEQSADQAALLPALATLLIVIWSLTANGHILARALSAPFPVGMSVSLAYFFINFLLLLQLRAPAL